MIRNDLPFQVCSYRRSGTHWLLATLFRAFDWPADVGGMIGVGQGRYWCETGEDPAFVPWADIFASHSTAPEVAAQTDLNRIVYIWRDPAAVMLSLWRFEGRRGSFRAFCERRLPLWQEHVLNYARADGPLLVRFTDLAAPGPLVDRIAAWAGAASRPGWEPVTERVGWGEPRTLPPKVADHAEYYHQAELACAALLDRRALHAAGLDIAAAMR